MSTQSHARNQHYVAQFYLRQFASGSGKRVRIHVFDKTTGATFSTRPRNVAAEVDFYETEDRGVERLLARAESAFALVIAGC